MASSTSKRIMMTMTALMAVGGAYAQVTSITTGTITPAPSSTSIEFTGTQTVDCSITTNLDNAPATVALNLDQAVTMSGAICWEIYSIDGGVVRAPITISVTATQPDFAPTSISLFEPTPSDVSATSSSSSNRAVKIIMPALVGSIVGAVLLAVATVYFFRLRARRKTQASRARRWAEQNRNSWAMKETSPKTRQDEAGFSQQPGYAFSGGSA